MAAAYVQKIVNLSEECRSWTRYGRNVKYVKRKNASKPLPQLSKSGQEFQLYYAGPIEHHKDKNIYISPSGQRRILKLPQLKGLNLWVANQQQNSYNRTSTHSEYRNRSELTSFWDLMETLYRAEMKIEQKYCPRGDHRGCGLIERTIQTMKRRVRVILLDELRIW